MAVAEGETVEVVVDEVAAEVVAEEVAEVENADASRSTVRDKFQEDVENKIQKESSMYHFHSVYNKTYISCSYHNFLFRKCGNDLTMTVN